MENSDRKTLIRLASTLPKGSDERKAILAGLSRRAATGGIFWMEVQGKNVAAQLGMPLSGGSWGYADEVINDLGYKMSKAFHKALKDAIPGLRGNVSALVNPKMAGVGCVKGKVYGVSWTELNPTWFEELSADEAADAISQALEKDGWKRVSNKFGGWV